MSVPDSSLLSPSILVVVLNYRTAQLTIDCLASLVTEVQSYPGVKVVVVDNASGDGSAEAIGSAIAAHGWQDRVSLLPMEHNGGYAFGNNAPIRQALQSDHPPDYVWLLNPDTLVHPNALGALMQFMAAHPEVGIAGSRLEDPDGTPQCSAFRFHSFLSELDNALRLGLVTQLIAPWVVAPPVPSTACQTDWVAGASMFVRKAVFDQVGLMDEDYFLYYEEVDFCLQAQRAGWSCWYVPDSRVVHFVGQASGITDTRRAPKRRPQYWFDSRRRYFLKNYGWFYAALADAAKILGLSLWNCRRFIQGIPDSDPPHFFNDTVKNSIFLKGI